MALEDFGSELSRQIQSAAEYNKPLRIAQSELANDVILNAIKNRIEQQNPLNQFLQRGQIADVENKLYEAYGIMPSMGQQMFQGQPMGQPGMGQPGIGQPGIGQPMTGLNDFNQQRFGTFPSAYGMQSQALEPQGGGEQDFRIMPDKLDKFGRPTGFKFEENPESETRREVSKQARTASEKEKQVNAVKLKRLGSIIDTVEKEWVKTTPPGSRNKSFPFVGRGLAGISAIGARLQSTPGQVQDSSYISFLNGIRAQLARSMGDVGNLSEYEQKAVMSLLPTITDTKEVGLEKIKKIKLLINNISNPSNQSTPLGPSVGNQGVPNYNPKTQKLQQNQRTGEYRVVPK